MGERDHPEGVLAQAASEVTNGDHACVLFRSDAHRTAAVGAYARRAAADGMRLLYISGRGQDAGSAELRAAGIDDAGADGRAQVVVRDARDVYRASGEFDPDAMIGMLREQAASAEAEGCCGLRVAGEMEWALDRGPDVEALAEYECRVDDVFRDTGAAGLCLYDRRRFAADACADAAHVHPLVLSEPRGAPSEPWEQARVERGAPRMLTIAGEIDRLNADSIEASLRAEAARTRHLRLDLRGLRFIDVAGMRGLYRVAEDNRREGGTTTVFGAPRVLRDAMEFLGISGAGWLAWETA